MPARGAPGNRGEMNPKAKLTADQVVEIRKRHNINGEPIPLLAFGFQVSGTWISGIVTGKFWRTAGGPTRPVKPHRITRVGTWFCPIDGFELEQEVSRIGRVVTRCVGCERRRAHRCMDCNAKVEGRAWRCPLHRRLWQNRLVNECDQRHREEYSRENRRRYFADPARRQRKLDYKKDWRRKNPKKVLMQKRRARLRGCGGYATREKWLAYHARYRETNRERLRANSRRIYYEKHPERPSCICEACGGGVLWNGRGRPAKRCAECKAKARPQPRTCNVCGVDVPYSGRGQPPVRCEAHRRRRKLERAA